jgi:hypothetical protein
MDNIQTISFFQSNNATPPSTTNGYANTMTVTLPVPMELVDSEVALSSLFCYYSWPNISDQLQNNSFTYTLPPNNSTWTGGTVFNVETTSGLGKLADGLYTIDDINNVLAFTFKNNGHYYLDANGTEVYPITLQVNPSTYRVQVTYFRLQNPLPTGWSYPGGSAAFQNLNNAILRLNIPTTAYPAGSSGGFGMSSISRVFGIPVGPWPTLSDKSTPLTTTDYTSYTGTSVPQVTTTNSVSVTCNLVNASKVSPVAGNIIYTFSPSTTSGSQIQEKPNNLNWLPVTDGRYNQIQIVLENDAFQNLQIQDPAICCTLLLRSKKSYARQKRGYDQAMVY